MNKNFVLIIFALIIFASCDKEKRKLREGNDSYKESNYQKAEEQYRESLVSDSNYLKAQYNLANASYKQQKQEKLQTSLKYYEEYLKGNSINDTINNANAIYNRGNVNFQLFNSDTTNEPSAKMQYLEKACEDYKQTLRLNPEDSAAKYNLALTQYLLKKNQDNKNSVIKTQKIVEDPLHSSQSDPLANISFPIKNQSDDYHKVKIQLLNNLIPSLIKSVNEDKINDAIKKGDIINKFISNIT
jgi:tetratricopeptide (TPR) repeat protein